MNTEVMQTPQLSTARLILLGVSSVILCMSFVMSVFAPFPLALAIILYGRTKGYLTCVLGMLISLAVSILIYKSLVLFGFYVMVLIFGVALAEIVQRGTSPIKGLVSFGLVFIGLSSIGFGVFLGSQKMTTREFIMQELEKSKDQIEAQKKIIEQSGEKDSIQVLELLERPEVMANELIQNFPSYYFMIIFLMLWFNMFMVLKSRRLLFSGQDHPYTEKNLLEFKVPFSFVIVLAIGLTLAIWGNDFGGTLYETIGYSIIKCLGVFYFFQGFGVFSDLLNFIGATGILRTIIVMLVVFMASYLVAVTGLFDNWFDFRKYFIKQKMVD